MLNIVTAFEAEARPFIEHLGLMREQANAEFKIYTAHRVNLGISGMGRGNAEKMTRYLCSKSRSEAGNGEFAWLNFGIAGAGSLALGDLVCASTVTSSVSGQKWTLAPVQQYTGRTGDVFTVEQPVSDYQEDCIYDMESAGVLAVLESCSPTGVIMIAKLVSDNPHYPVNSITREVIRDRIHEHRSKIASLADLLIKPE